MSSILSAENVQKKKKKESTEDIVELLGSAAKMNECDVYTAVTFYN